MPNKQSEKPTAPSNLLDELGAEPLEGSGFEAEVADTATPAPETGSEVAHG